MKDPIRTLPGTTNDGKPFDFYLNEQVRNGTLTVERVSRDILGTPRDLEIYRTTRKTGFIADWVNTAADREYCCEYRCPDCFLILTHRVKTNPSRHILYDNQEDLITAARRWLVKPSHRKSLGLGMDCSDSLLYERVTGYARALIPIFAVKEQKPLLGHLPDHWQPYFLFAFCAGLRQGEQIGLKPEDIAWSKK
jgi:hypothetical protein